MIDQELVDERRLYLCDRYTAEELVSLLDISTESVFDRFFDECLDLDMEEL